MGRIINIFSENYRKKPRMPDGMHGMSSDFKQQITHQKETDQSTAVRRSRQCGCKWVSSP